MATENHHIPVGQNHRRVAKSLRRTCLHECQQHGNRNKHQDYFVHQFELSHVFCVLRIFSVVFFLYPHPHSLPNGVQEAEESSRRYQFTSGSGNEEWKIRTRIQVYFEDLTFRQGQDDTHCQQRTCPTKVRNRVLLNAGQVCSVPLQRKQHRFGHSLW